MATLYYFDQDSATWKPISGGASGGGGTPGPAGESVEVYGPQTPEPTPNRKGDMWLVNTPIVGKDPTVYPTLAPAPQIVIATIPPREPASFLV